MAATYTPLLVIANDPVDDTPPSPGVVHLKQLSDTSVAISFSGFLDEETQLSSIVVTLRSPASSASVCISSIRVARLGLLLRLEEGGDELEQLGPADVPALLEAVVLVQDGRHSRHHRERLESAEGVLCD